MKTGKITINKSLNKNGVEYLDTVAHENLHLKHPKMSEKGIENKAKVGRTAYLSVI